MEKIRLHDKMFRLAIPNAKIMESVSMVASGLNAEYGGEKTPPVIVGILNGSFMFAAELAQKLSFQAEISFVKMSSYSGTSSTGKVNTLLGLNNDVMGRRTIIVEDIVETGKTIRSIYDTLVSAGAEDVNVCTLFFKPEAYAEDIPVRFPAMELGNDFIVGFGLDYNGLGRQYKDIYVIDNQ